MSKEEVVSNLVGPDGTAIDRIYSTPAIGVAPRLIQKDFSVYAGNINKRATTVKDLDGNRFRSYCYVTDDDRWFDRAGMPIDKPKNLLKGDSNE